MRTLRPDYGARKSAPDGSWIRAPIGFGFEEAASDDLVIATWQKSWPDPDMSCCA